MTADHPRRRYRAIPAYYDAEYADNEILRHDVPFFLDHLPAARKGRRQVVLELAVGTGRAAVPIAQAGHRVVGVDYDPDLLEIAGRKRDAAGLAERDLTLELGNVLSLDLGRRFDWVCLLFNTFLAFPTLAEQDQLLQGVRRHLKPRGRFWLDIFYPDLSLLADAVHTDLDPITFRVPQLNRTVSRTTDLYRDPIEQIQRLTFHYRWFDPKGRPRHERRTFDMTYLFPRELRILLERNGLRIDRLYGNYDGSGPTNDSPRLIASCKLL